MKLQQHPSRASSSFSEEEIVVALQLLKTLLVGSDCKVLVRTQAVVVGKLIAKFSQMQLSIHERLYGESLDNKHAGQ